MVYIAYQWPGFGLYPGVGGRLEVPYAASRTARYVRGGNVDQRSMEYPYGSGTELTYEQWATNLQAAGVGAIRVAWFGWQEGWGSPHYSFEPPPHGTYNIWHSALDSTNLTTYRAHQVSGSPGDGTFPLAYWTGSNIKKMLDACQAHDIKIILTFFTFTENMYSGWAYHAWNYNNRYLGGGACEAQDKGFLSSAWQMYTDADAIQAFKDRITFAINLVQEYTCVAVWEYGEEINWTWNADFWERVSFDSTQIANIRNYVVPWIEEIGKHIRATDSYNRPIGLGVARAPFDGIWPGDANHYWNVMMEPFLQYPVDIVFTNLYHGNYDLMMIGLNAVREKVYPKKVFVHQYYPCPWLAFPGEVMRREYPPYTQTKKIEWLGIVMKWSLGPGRWIGIYEEEPNYWTAGGYADPAYYGSQQVTNLFNSYIDWRDWYQARDWGAYISSSGLKRSVTTGDGDHVTGVFVWTSGGAKTITITGVTDGAWTFKFMDWTNGTLQATETPTAAGNRLDVSVTPGYEYLAVLSGEKD